MDSPKVPFGPTGSARDELSAYASLVTTDRAGTTSGTMRPMTKTTLHLPDDLREAVRRVARQRGVSEAEVIRESLRATIGRQRPKPRGGLFASGSPVARDADRQLAGFGER